MTDVSNTPRDLPTNNVEPLCPACGSDLNPTDHATLCPFCGCGSDYAERRIMDWLEGLSIDTIPEQPTPGWYADAIERGEHRA